jgi:hypothetical protein
LQLADLVPTLAGQEKQAHHIAKGIITKTAPQLAQFLRSEHTLTTAILSGFGCPGDRVQVE